MLFMSSARRAQTARNKRKAAALVAEHGDGAANYVREQIAATTWQIRDHAHWQRIEKHVKALLRR
jgi:hypothetical protein